MGRGQTFLLKLIFTFSVLKCRTCSSLRSCRYTPTFNCFNILSIFEKERVFNGHPLLTKSRSIFRQMYRKWTLYNSPPIIGGQFSKQILLHFSLCVLSLSPSKKITHQMAMILVSKTNTAVIVSFVKYVLLNDELLIESVDSLISVCFD